MTQGQFAVNHRPKRCVTLEIPIFFNASASDFHIICPKLKYRHCDIGFLEIDNSTDKLLKKRQMTMKISNTDKKWTDNNNNVK